MPPKKKVWELDAHTEAKHELLRRYLGAWFPILGGRHRKVLFLDGFAGPGVYAGGQRGSPIIALDTLVNHAIFPKLSETKFMFGFVEERDDRRRSLEAEVAKFWDAHPGGQPSNVEVRVFPAAFAEVAEGVIESVHGAGKQLVPTLAFIDPFGFSGVPLTLIAELLSSNRCEVLFNFMYDSVNRWATDERPGIAKHIAELFGTEEGEYLAVEGLQSSAEREQFLSDLYVRQLRTVGGFTYARSFALTDVDRGRTVYYLMYGTRHHKGLQVMKDAMWALDPVGGARFSGDADGQAMLFGDVVDTAPLRAAIVARFGGSTVRVQEIERFVIEHTDYKTSHYKKQVLKPLEEEGRLQVVDPPPKRRWGTYPAGTVLRFERGS